MNSQTEYTKIIDNDSHKFSEGVVNNIINSVYQLQYAGAKTYLSIKFAKYWNDTRSNIK